MLSFLNSSVLAIDLGTSSIKVAHMSRKGQKNQNYHLQHCDLIDIHPGLIDERGYITDTNKLVVYLKQILQKYKINAQKCVLAIPAHCIVRDIVQLESDDSKDQAYDLEIEASRMIPPSIQASFDYRLIEASNINSNTAAGNPFNKFELFVTAKDLVDQRLDLIQALKDKKEVNVIDSEEASAFRAIHHIWEQEQTNDQIRAVMHLGHTHSKFFVFRGQDLIYQQDLVINGLQLTQQIIRYYQYSHQDAMYKKQTASEFPEGFNDAILKPYIENASIDIVQAIQNFFTSGQFSRIDGIYAFGGHALTPNFLSYIGQKTQLPTQLLNPFFGLSKSNDIDEHLLKANMSRFLPVIGMAMRGLAEIN